MAARVPAGKDTLLFHNRVGTGSRGFNCIASKNCLFCMSPTSGMHHSWLTDLVISRVAVRLQNAFELSQNRFGPSRPRPKRKSKTTVPPGRLYLPQIRLVIVSPAPAFPEAPSRRSPSADSVHQAPAVLARRSGAQPLWLPQKATARWHLWAQDVGGSSRVNRSVG
jgi:hypothetical protein